MTCDDILHLITARIDGEISTTDNDDLAEHLQSCSACRMTSEALSRQDGALRRAFTEPRDAAAAVADRLIADMQPRPRRASWIAAGVVTGALAAALAMMAVLRPAPQPTTPEPLAGDPRPTTPAETVGVDTLPIDPIDMGPPDPLAPEPALAPFAVLAMATGHVEIDSSSCTNLASTPVDSHLETGSTIRTAADADAEWHLRDGAVLRVQGGSELYFSGGALNLRRGRMWLGQPETAPAMPVILPGYHVDFSGGELDVLTDDAGNARVAVLAGQATVRDNTSVANAQNGALAVEVPAGHELALSDAGAWHPTPIDDGVLHTMWIHDLLSRKGRDDPEMADRAAHLIDRLRTQPNDARFARAIRACGFGASAPLSAAVTTASESTDPRARDQLATLLADLAEPWCIPDLIGLIHDTDAEVRVAAARGLHRLTGQTFGRTPEYYGDPNNVFVCDSNTDPWTLWWKENAHRYPRP